MKEQIEQIKASAMQELANVTTAKELDDVRVKYLGKKGELTSVLRGMGALSSEERPVIGGLVNTVKTEIEDVINKKEDEFKALELKRK